jgi:hypothetical protein
MATNNPTHENQYPKYPDIIALIASFNLYFHLKLVGLTRTSEALRTVKHAQYSVDTLNSQQTLPGRTNPT